MDNGKNLRQLGAEAPAVPFSVTDMGLPSLSLSPDGRTLGIARESHTLQFLDLATGKKRVNHSGAQVPITSVDFTPDGKYMLTQDRPLRAPARWKTEPTFRRWEAADGKTAGTISVPSPARLVAVSPGADLIVVQPDPLDGKCLLVDHNSGRELGALQAPDRFLFQSLARCVAFAPDNKTLASGSTDTTALTWNVAGLEQKLVLTASGLGAEAIQARWATLASIDAGKAMDAISDLAAAPGHTIPFLKARLKPAPAFDVQRVEELLAQLDDVQFKLRENAKTELSKFGEEIVPLLDKALAGKPPLEARRRLEDLRARLTSTILSGEALQIVRAIEVLERIGTAEARAVLQTLAAGPDRALPTITARAALRRMRAQ